MAVPTAGLHGQLRKQGPWSGLLNPGGLLPAQRKGNAASPTRRAQRAATILSAVAAGEVSKKRTTERHWDLQRPRFHSLCSTGVVGFNHAENCTNLIPRRAAGVCGWVSALTSVKIF